MSLHVLFETITPQSMEWINWFQGNFRTAVKSKRLYFLSHTKALGNSVSAFRLVLSCGIFHTFTLPTSESAPEIATTITSTLLLPYFLPSKICSFSQSVHASRCFWQTRARTWVNFAHVCQLSGWVSYTCSHKHRAEGSWNWNYSYRLHYTGYSLTRNRNFLPINPPFF
jgi:hypothetical protein